MQSNIYTVSQINAYAKQLMENDVFLAGCYVEGEISRFTLHSSGHAYFTVKDAKASVDCAMFRSALQGVGTMPRPGDKVLMYARASLYEATGRFQLIVNEMHPAGAGALHLAFEQLKNRLAAEGLFDEAHKKPLPPLPRTVAVVTSPTGAAIRDIINVAGRRNPTVKLVVVPVLVQGENAAADIARGIESVNKWGGADIMIVGRGGGSKEDLWAFNEEVVARAIFASKIPVISAVGHQIDVSISDFVADIAAPTPSAAAELAVPAQEPLDSRNKNALVRIGRAMKARMESAELRFSHAVSVRAMTRPLDGIYEHQIHIENCLDLMKKAVERRMDICRAGLEKNMAAVENLSPINVVKRGYSLVFDENGGLIKSTSGIKENDVIGIEFADGKITASVKTVE